MAIDHGKKAPHGGAFFLKFLSRPEIALHKKKCNEKRLCKAYPEGLYDVI